MTDKFKKMCEVYRLFAEPWAHVCDFSDKAMQEMFEFETFGRGRIEITGFNTMGIKSNGFAVGKKWVNVTVEMWLDNIQRFGLEYQAKELLKDREIPKWFIRDFFRSFLKKQGYSKRAIEECIYVRE